MGLVRFGRAPFGAQKPSRLIVSTSWAHKARARHARRADIRVVDTLALMRTCSPRAFLHAAVALMWNVCAHVQVFRQYRRRP
jgi:hypothetical protein